jgi:hypothetical protein
MPPGPELLHPEGMFENSPAFQRRVGTVAMISPEGTAEAQNLEASDVSRRRPLSNNDGPLSGGS